MRRNKKLVKVLTGTLATAMLVSGTIPAYAATETSGATSTLSVETGEAVDGSNQVSVYAEIGSSYTVTIPKTITLDRSTKTGTYTVSVTGDIAGDEVVKIVPDASLTMSQTDKADVTASVTQDKTAWEVSEFGTAGNGSISASGLTAGAWNGTFNFNVGLKKVYGEDVTLTSSNLATYGIAKEGDVVIPEYVTDSDGVKHKVTSIGKYTFEFCSGLTSITIPDSVTYIGDEAFYGCSGITSITIPDSVTYISSSAFYNCSGLTSITIPDSVNYIGNDTFYGCSGITSITIPDSVTGIGNNAFKSCKGLTSITIPDSVTYIGGGAFEWCSGLTSITIPDSVTSIEKNTFDGCKGLTSITIPDSVTYIGGGAFRECTKLTSITIPDSVTYIGDEAFEWCSGITSITIPDSVTSIGDEAFDGCKGLTSITIPDSVTYIGGGAFRECTKLTSITIPDSVTSIGEIAFGYCRGLSTVTYKGQTYTSKSALLNVLSANGVKIGDNNIFNYTSLTN